MTKRSRYPRGGAGTWLANGLTAVILLFLFSPVLIVVPFSLTPTDYLSLPQGSLSTKWYAHLFSSPEWQSSIWQSIYIAFACMSLSVLLGTAAAVGLWRISSRLSEFVRNFCLMPLLVPPIVSGMAFFYAFAKLRLLDTPVALILAHTILAVPYVVLTVSSSLANFDVRLEQAARNLGASIGQSLRLVILPSILPGITAGAIFAFIMSWDEVVVTLFITSFNVFTLPRRLWDGIRFETDPTTAACATSLIALTLLGVAIYLIFIWSIERRAKSRPAT